jgi:GntR family transcriptional regulator, rspAB operon transcriptional repressor
MGEVIALETVKRTDGSPARVQVYAALRQAIVRGELEPGQQLSENALATELGVSRTPVREALSRLRDERLVEIVPQFGTFVSRISPQAVGDAQFIREALECACVRRASELSTEDDIATLEDNLRAQERARDSDDFDAFYVLDDAFHHALCDMSEHRAVWPVSQRARGHLNRVRRLSMPVPSYLELMIEQHRRVVSAVADHDADGAEALLRDHLRNVLQEVPRIRAQHPGFFEEA